VTSPSPRPFVATYRLQLTPTFTFGDVIDVLDPIRDLGVSHLYLSPIAEAVAGSTHGYDVVDHERVRTEFGGEAGLAELLDAAGDHDLGVVIDHVPNHVSIERAELNPQWWAMLRDGPDSDAARWFDVEWDLTSGKVIVPKLGAPLADVVAQGALAIVAGADGPEVRYGPLRFPMAVGTESLPLGDALAAQHYELSWWRAPERNVRRFFTIDDLVAVRVEVPEVAFSVDTIPRRLADHDAFAGVRIDHVDGLADPAAYLQQLASVIGDRWLIVEKIVAPGETLPRSWPVSGTTGYEQITTAEHTLLDPAAFEPLDRSWRELADTAGRPHAFDQMERSARREVLNEGLRPDLERLVRTASRPGSPSIEGLRSGFIELTLALERYRTYLPDPESRDVIDAAERDAIERAPALTVEIAAAADLVRSDADVRTRWQQLTGPVMAKGAEDRAFYRHHRLSSLCEVGGDPGAWTYDVGEFHAHQRRVQSEWPLNMLTNTTHDTKRSAVVRSRSLVLAERAVDWSAFVTEWVGAHTDLTGSIRPPEVSLALQTAVTSAPVDADRLQAYLVKATREADIDTSWFEPDTGYESDLERLATHLATELAVDSSALAAWAAAIGGPGTEIGLRLLTLQLTCPGVPDLYQGAPAELLTLVDPDNRQPPDWAAWTSLIGRSRGTDVATALADDDPDLARTVLVRRLLEVRRRATGAFGPDAGYLPLTVTGPGGEHVAAFCRTDAAVPAVCVVVARALPDVSTVSAAIVELPPGSWAVVLGPDHHIEGTGAVPCSRLMDQLGVCVLERVSD